MGSWPRARRSDRRKLGESALAAIAVGVAGLGACTLVSPSDGAYTSGYRPDAHADGATADGGSDAPALGDGGCWDWCRPVPGANIGSWTFSPDALPTPLSGTLVDAGNCRAALAIDGG